MSASDGGAEAVPDADALLARLRERAADPARRTSSRPSQLSFSTRTMGTDGLLAMMHGLKADLDRTVAANRAGRVDPTGHQRADGLYRAMTTPAASDLPSPATTDAIEAAEHVLGVRLPPFLRRVYAELADGGFGPGEGLMPQRGVVESHRRLVDGAELPRGSTWPSGLVPLVASDPGYDCVDTASGRVIAWDPDGLSERSSEARFAKSFHEEAVSVEAWLQAWAGSRTRAELLAEAARRSQVDAARKSRAAIAAMTPAERAAMGVRAVGWEKVVWGGLGLEDDADG